MDPRSKLIGILVVGYLLASAVAWAMITPMGAAPDEPDHIAYAAGVVRGEFGELSAIENPFLEPVLATVVVPQWVGSIVDPPRSIENYVVPCYSFQADVTADCAPRMSHERTPSLTPTSVTRYPPPYHLLVGLPTLVLSGEEAVYAMRIVSAAVAVALIAVGLSLASPSRRTWLALAVLISFTPMVAHLAGAVNPSSMEIGASIGLGVGLMGFTGFDRGSPGTIVARFGVLVFALAWARPFTSLTLIAVIASGLLLNWPDLRAWAKRRTALIAVMALTGAAIASATAFQMLMRRPPTRSPLAASGIAPSVPPNTLLGLEGNLRDVEQHFIDRTIELVGKFGYVDHAPPLLVSAMWVGLALGVLTLALVYGRRSDRIQLGTLSVGALVVAPLFVMTTTLSATIYQARYHLPLAALIVVGAIVTLARTSESGHGAGGGIAWTLLRWGAVLAPAGMLLSIAGSLHRYSIGGVAQLANLPALAFGDRQWLPPGMAGAAAIIGAAVVVASSMKMWRVVPAQRTGTERAD